MPLTPELKVIGCGESPVGHLLPPTWRNLTAAARRKGEQLDVRAVSACRSPKVKSSKSSCVRDTGRSEAEDDVRTCTCACAGSLSESHEALADRSSNLRIRAPGTGGGGTGRGGRGGGTGRQMVRVFGQSYCLYGRSSGRSAATTPICVRCFGGGRFVKGSWIQSGRLGIQSGRGSFKERRFRA